MRAQHDARHHCLRRDPVTSGPCRDPSQCRRRLRTSPDQLQATGCGGRCCLSENAESLSLHLGAILRRAFRTEPARPLLGTAQCLQEGHACRSLLAATKTKMCFLVFLTRAPVSSVTHQRSVIRSDAPVPQAMLLEHWHLRVPALLRWQLAAKPPLARISHSATSGRQRSADAGVFRLQSQNRVYTFVTCILQNDARGAPTAHQDDENRPPGQRRGKATPAPDRRNVFQEVVEAKVLFKPYSSDWHRPARRSHGTDNQPPRRSTRAARSPGSGPRF